MTTRPAPPGRPAGDYRAALLQAAVRLHQAGTTPTWRDMAAQACVGLREARLTVENMARSGVLRPVGQVRAVHSNRPMTGYAPASLATGSADLDALMRRWGR